MAATSILLFLLLTVIITASAQQTRQANINPGSTLTPTTNPSWFSPSRIFAFGFYQQSRGYAICIFFVSDNTIVWTANRDNPFVPNNVNLLLTNDGRLVYRQAQGPDTNLISPSESIASASMLDNGNLVLYNSDSRIIWQSFDHPTNTLLPGQRLVPGQELFSSASTNDSSRGIFRLKMQGDGNLVQYPTYTTDTSSNSYYSSGTDRAGNNVTLNLGSDGHLYLFNGTSVINNITTGGLPTSTTIYLLRVDVDGIFRLYSRSLASNSSYTVIYSPTEDKCVPKGLCGLNGFCVPMDQAAECRCLPGYDFLIPGNWSAGCARNFFAKGYETKDNKSVQYEIRTLDNVVWEDNAYTLLNTVTQDQCREACLNDCSCDVAFFKDRQCRKQRIPVRYGRRVPSDSNTVLVKVYTPATETTTDDSGGGTKGEKDDKKLRTAILIVGISLTVLGLLIIVTGLAYIRRNNAKDYKRITEYGDANMIKDVGLRAFSYGDLVQVMNGFAQELGKGASGTVYKGALTESQKLLVAVKRLEKEFAQGDAEFRNEMKVIGKTYHRNLVRLLGYCLEGANRLLVFEYMSNGSLADFLFRQEGRPRWEDRVRIARDIARGILYLHEECESSIIHCDIKPQNILMDERGCAKISDFGLAKLLKQDQTNTYTGIRGTKGYVAPEWHQRQPVTVKADVYSFGIVLLEIVCCRKSVDWSLAEDQAVLEEWVYNCYEAREIQRLVGDEEVELRKLERMVKIGIWCIQDEPSLRPTMKKVLLMLEGTVEIPVPPSPSSFLSSFAV